MIPFNKQEGETAAEAADRIADDITTNLPAPVLQRLVGKYEVEVASLKAEVERLKMCQSDKATKSILYTDTIGGEQVCRDDMWAISTTTLNALTASEQRVKELEAEAQEEQDEFRRVVEDDRAKDEVHCGCCVELRLRVKKLEGLLEHSSLYLHDYLNIYYVNLPVQEMIERIDKELKGE